MRRADERRVNDRAIRAIGGGGGGVGGIAVGGAR